MDILYYLFASAAGVALALGSIAIWAPRPIPVRVTAVVIVALFLPVLYLQMLEMLSKPKPMSFEWYEANANRAQLLGASMIEGESIFLWLRIDNSLEPRSYVVPWNLKLAEKLENDVTNAIRRNSTVIIKKPFYRRSLEEWGDLNIEIKPPPLLPQKNPPLPAQVFNPREEKI